jgi:hypothetical protein
MSIFSKLGSKVIGKATKPKPVGRRRGPAKRGMVKEAKKILSEAEKNKKINRRDYNKLKDMAAKEKVLNKEKKAQALLKKGSFQKVRKELPLAVNDNIIQKNKLRVVSSSKEIKRKKGGKVMSGQDFVNSFYD